MGFLAITRLKGEELIMRASADANDAELINLLKTVGIRIHVTDAMPSKVLLGIQAPKEIIILRTELSENGAP